VHSQQRRPVLRNQAEFVEALRALEFNRWISGSLGRNGRQYYRDNYDWPVIERKYLDMLARLSAGSASGTRDALPGWMERRKETCDPAASVLAAVPAGPSTAPEMTVPRPSGPVSPPLPRRPPSPSHTTERSRNEQPRKEQSRSEQSRSEQSRNEQSRSERPRSDRSRGGGQRGRRPQRPRGRAGQGSGAR
jgi:hypothetical protein